MPPDESSANRAFSVFIHDGTCHLPVFLKKVSKSPHLAQSFTQVDISATLERVLLLDVACRRKAGNEKCQRSGRIEPLAWPGIGFVQAEIISLSAP
jgi:hypothetical protein